MSVGDIIGYGLRLTPGIAAILMPAAVLAATRCVAADPDGLVRDDPVRLGPGAAVLADPLQPIFASLTPASDDLPYLVPLAAIYNAVVSPGAAFGRGYIALGLVEARRYEDRPADAAALVVPVAATLATIIGVLAVSRFHFGDTPMTPPLTVYLASSVVLGVLRVVVWAYLAAAVTRGWWSGEEPSAGWWLAVLATASSCSRSPWST